MTPAPSTLGTQQETASFAGSFHPMPKPEKKTRPGVLRKKARAKSMKEWHEIVCERARVSFYHADETYRYKCFHCGYLFPRNMVTGDHYPYSRGARPDLKLDPDNGVCSCMECNTSNSPTRKHS